MDDSNSSTLKNERQIVSGNSMIQSMKNQCIDKIGKDNFHAVYKMFKEGMEKGESGDKIYKKVKEYVKNAELLKECYFIEEIIYREQMTS